MVPTVAQILEMLDEIAPFSTAEEWDNVGLLVGDSESTVSKALLALDLTKGVIEEAVEIGASLIITHHPTMFHARKTLLESDVEGHLLRSLVRNNIALIASHTCLDRCAGGTADTLASALDLRNISSAGDGFLRIGEVVCTEFSSFAHFVSKTLASDIRLYGPRSKAVHTCLVCPGSGGSFVHEVIALHADCYVTGEIGHHDILEAVENDICVVEAGHYETERIVLPGLCRRLQSAAESAGSSVSFTVSQYTPFGV